MDEKENKIKREDGFYWVKFRGKWMIAYWTNYENFDSCWTSGKYPDNEFFDSDFKQIDERKLTHK